MTRNLIDSYFVKLKTKKINVELLEKTLFHFDRFLIASFIAQKRFTTRE